MKRNTFPYAFFVSLRLFRGFTFVRCVAVLTLISFAGWVTACTTCKKLPIQTAADYQAIQIDPQRDYIIQFTDGQEWKIKGDHLIINKDLIGIRFEDQQDYQYYRLTQLKGMCARQFSTGRTLGFVAGGLVVLGGILTGVIIGAVGSAQK